MSTPKIPGRPRDPAVDNAILDEAVRQLAELGYSRMSIASVADSAGVSRPSIYRRFPTKADLAMAALAERIDHQARPPADLDVETAMIQALRHLAQRLRAKHSMALVGTLLVEEEQTPELIRLFRERLWETRANLLREIIERGRERGELHPDVDSEVVVGMLIGSLYAAHLSLAKIPRGWPARTVRAALEGMR
jgi:AcrR family transcriptional regulator